MPKLCEGSCPTSVSLPRIQFSTASYTHPTRILDFLIVSEEAGPVLRLSLIYIVSFPYFMSFHQYLLSITQPSLALQSNVLALAEYHDAHNQSRGNAGLGLYLCRCGRADYRGCCRCEKETPSRATGTTAITAITANTDGTDRTVRISFVEDRKVIELESSKLSRT